MEETNDIASELPIFMAEKPADGLEEFSASFIQSRNKELQELRLKLGTQEGLKQLALIAHQWKGFSAPYGFQFLATIAIQIEQACSAADHNRCSSLLNKAERYLLIKEKLLSLPHA